MVGKNDGSRETSDAECTAVLKKFIKNSQEVISNIDNELIKLLIQNPRVSRQDLSKALRCSGPTVTKRFQHLFDIRNMQIFRNTHSDSELLTLFRAAEVKLGEQNE